MKPKFYILLVALALVSIASEAQMRNYMYLSLGGEYTGLLDTKRLASPWLGGSGEVGIGYEMQLNRFLMDVGISASVGTTINRIMDTTVVFQAYDTEGEQFDFIHTYTKNNNQCAMVYINIPLLFGAKIGQNGYFLLGAKVGINAYGTTSVNSLLTTRAEYPQYIGIMENMANHQLVSNHPLSGSNVRSRFDMNLALGGELGYNFHSFTRETGFDVPKHTTQYRFGVYAYYGLLDMFSTVKGTNTSAFGHSGGGSEPIRYQLTHIYLSRESEGVKVHPLSVGVRFTVLFKLPDPKNCVICRESQVIPNPSGTRREIQRLIDAQ